MDNASSPILFFSLSSVQFGLSKSIFKCRAYPSPHLTLAINDRGQICAYCPENNERALYSCAQLIDHFHIGAIVILLDFTPAPSPKKEKNDNHVVSTSIEQQNSYAHGGLLLGQSITNGTRSIYMDLPRHSSFPPGVAEKPCNHPVAFLLFQALSLDFSQGEIIFAECHKGQHLSLALSFLTEAIAMRKISPCLQALQLFARHYHCTQSELSKIDQLMRNICIHRGVDSLYKSLDSMHIGKTNVPSNISKKSDAVRVLIRLAEPTHETS